MQCSNSFAFLVTERILHVYKGIKTAGAFYIDSVKKLMERLMLLALSAYFEEMRE